MSAINADIVIPARYASSRFPGKPLARISGVPLIKRVYDTCLKVVSAGRIWVATDDQRIMDYCLSENIQFIQTSTMCLTGTDRVAEANEILGSELVINVQGDEPCLVPDDIIKVYRKKLEVNESVVNGYCLYDGNLDVVESNIPKVVVNEKGELVYISRSNIPYVHSGTNSGYAKLSRQVCIYAFSANQLQEFRKFGRKSNLESIEDIEILRFFELSISVQMVELHSSIAVDYPRDIKLVEEFLSRKNQG